MKTSTLRNAISIALFAGATGMSGLAIGQGITPETTVPSRAPVPSSPVRVDVDLPAGTLAAALDALRAQSGLRLDYPPELVAGKQGRAVWGHMSWTDALRQLLQGSGLTYRQANDGTVVITRSQEIADSGSRSASDRSPPTTPPAPPAASELETITVTGTRIRGGSTPSPVITIGSEQIQQEGFSNLGKL